MFSPPQTATSGRAASVPQLAFVTARRTGVRASVRALVLLAGLGLTGAPAHADPDAELPGEAVAVVADAREMDALVSALSDSLALVDHAIRTLSGASDRVASRALNRGIGALAVGQDDRMNAQTTTLLANSATAAVARFEFAATSPPPVGELIVYAPDR
jgi:hypothetical protein